MADYERATLKLATLKTSDVGECAAEVWADKAERKRRPLNRPCLILQVARIHCVEESLDAELRHTVANAISMSQIATAVNGN